MGIDVAWVVCDPSSEYFYDHGIAACDPCRFESVEPNPVSERPDAAVGEYFDWVVAMTADVVMLGEILCSHGESVWCLD